MSTNHNSTSSPDDRDPNELDTLAGEYVLGTLDSTQRRSVEIRMAHEPALSTAVQAWEERLFPLTAMVLPADPGAELWPRIAASVAPARRAQTNQAARRWWNWDSLLLWRGLAGSGFAAAAVLATALLVQQAAPPPAARYFVVLAAPQNQAPGWLVQAQAAGKLRLVPLGIDSVPEEKSLQFWTKADSWSAPVSLGLVRPGEAIEVPVDQLPPLQPNQLFELTLEPAGGSPIGKPTGPIQFIGRAVQI